MEAERWLNQMRNGEVGPSDPIERAGLIRLLRPLAYGSAHMSIAESGRLQPAVEALLRANSWRAPAPALRATRVARAATRGLRWHRAQSSCQQCADACGGGVAGTR